MRTLAVVICVALFAAPIVAAAQSMTPAEVYSMTAQQYHKEKGPCACPDDKDKVGNKCGKQSAFCQTGGVEIKNCYLKDVERRKKEACWVRDDSAY
jgi:hypothetical protein